MFIKKRHKRAIGDKWGNAIGFVRREFERPDPQENYGDRQSHEVCAKGVEFADELQPCSE
jgi:hypothetical protein